VKVRAFRAFSLKSGRKVNKKANLRAKLRKNHLKNRATTLSNPYLKGQIKWHKKEKNSPIRGNFPQISPNHPSLFTKSSKFLLILPKISTLP
jgi:hypothetical protein